jgi:hypothetical protein
MAPALIYTGAKQTRHISFVVLRNHHQLRRMLTTPFVRSVRWEQWNMDEFYAFPTLHRLFFLTEETLVSVGQSTDTSTDILALRMEGFMTSQVHQERRCDGDAAANAPALSLADSGRHSASQQ